MTTKEIGETLRYCEAHCDNDGELAMVHWVAWKLAERIYKNDMRQREFVAGYCRHFGVMRPHPVRA